MRLFLIRHGETTANLVGALDTAPPGKLLTELGQRQARAAGVALKSEGIEALYCSDALRAQQTADHMTATLGHKATVIGGLREIQAGGVEDRTDPDSVQIYLKTVIAWATGDLDARMPGAENGHEFLARYDASIQQIMDGGHKVAALVSHGAAIRAWAALRATAAEGVNTRADFNNTSCMTMEFNGSGWELHDWNPHPLGGAHLLAANLLDRTNEPPTEELAHLDEETETRPGRIHGRESPGLG
ncbi:MAG TPA: histidine phosphatase family protein [Propionibacterium sp.]|jgi:probable phosphoglycerate mutase|nr:histidine phosphatase family protein [Propionibacterium sp.]